MKTRLILIAISGSLLTLSSLFSSAQQFSFTDPWGDEGMTLMKSAGSEVQVLFSVHSFGLEQQPGRPSGEVQALLHGHFLGNDPGAPNLPGSGYYIAVPDGAEVEVEITDIRKERYQDINIGPAPEIPFDSEAGALVYEKDSIIYGKDAFYPAEPVKTSGIFKIRGVETVMLGITPFQYNPVTRELVVIRDVRVKVRFVGGNGEFGEERLRSRHWDPLLNDLLLNIDQLPDIDYSRRISAQNHRDTDGCEYLIIVPDGADFQQWADTIREFRVREGITTNVVTLTEVGGNTTTAIENYIDNAYNTWDIPPSGVLLMADYGTDPLSAITSFSYSHPYSGTFITDNTYADVDGDDLPEMYFARMAANNAAELETMITKFIDYETNPPTDPGFYDHPITALGWQTERWFQICSETVGGFFSNELGKSPVRINDVYGGDPSVDPWSTATNTSTVLDYFGPSGQGYIPSSPSALGGWTGGTATDVNNAINDGAFILQHRDHGYEFGWGEPSYSNSNIDGLTNTDLSFIMSINCLTGRFDHSSECFAEKFHRYEYGGANSGALGLIAASQVSYSFVNDTYVWGFYDYLWPEFMPDYTSNPLPRGLNPCFANAAGKYYLQQSNWPYNSWDKQITYRLFHHHGDAFLNLYSEIPQALTITCDSSIISTDTTFTVTANSSAFIALSYNGELLATDQSEGNPVELTFNAGLMSGDHLLLVVTGRNYYRYEQEISILPASGPCVVLDQLTVIDTSFNGNGMLDYGETGYLGIQMMNSGVDAAENFWVSFAHSDQWFALSTDSIHVDSIPAGQSIMLDINPAFSLNCAVPDGHQVELDIISRVGSDSWTSSENLPCRSPFLYTEGSTIDDMAAGNGNGLADPGETVNLEVDISNSGSCQSDSLSITIDSDDPDVLFSNDSVRFASIAAAGSGVAVFTMTTGANMEPGTIVRLFLEFFDDRGSVYNDTLEISIGKKPVLIVDLDPNNTSGPAMQTAIENNGVPADYLTSMPADLDIYSSVFVHLGIYSSNHVLSASEGTQLAGYLNQGGNLYMEGGDTWCFDSQTDVHPMFSIDPVADGSADMATVVGVSGTVFEGFSFPYSGENNWMDRIGASGTSVAVLNNSSPSYGTVVIYDGGAHKTIGASHEFGGLDDGTSTKTQLAGKYLRFFDIPLFNEWLGNNTNWDDPANWSNGLVPDPNTHVTIPAATTRGYFPAENRSGEMDCKTLTVEPGSSFTIPVSSTMHIHN